MLRCYISQLLKYHNRHGLIILQSPQKLVKMTIIPLRKGKKPTFLYSAVSNPQDDSKCFTLYSLTNLFNQTSSQLLWEAYSRMLQLMHEGCSYTYPPLSVARYSSIQLNVLHREKKAQGINTTAQDSRSSIP